VFSEGFDLEKLIIIMEESEFITPRKTRHQEKGNGEEERALLIF